MSTTTTNYSLSKPAVNSATDEDLWGTLLNTNMDTIDTQMLLGRDWKKRSITGTDSVVAADRHKILLCDATSAAFTLTLLAAATAADGFQLTIVKTDASSNAVTIDGNSSETIGGATTFTLSGQGDAATLICDGSNWNFAGNKTTPSSVASASTTTQGIIEIATDAEFVTGTDTARAITAANIKAGLGFTTYYESAEQSVTLSSAITLTHSLGSIPKLLLAELVCKTTDVGYAVGDRIPFTTVMGSSAAAARVIGISYNATQITISYDATAMILENKSGGSTTQITPANWRVIVRAWA